MPNNDNLYYEYYSKEQVGKKDKGISKGIGVAIVAAAFLAGASGLAIESRVEHTKEMCPFTYVLGLNHQVKAINREKNGISARFEEVDNIPEGYSIYQDENGEISYIKKIEPRYEIVETVPKGYTIEYNLRGEKIGVARSIDGTIVGIADVTRTTKVIYPEGTVFINGDPYITLPEDKKEIIGLYNEKNEMVNSISLGK